MLLLKAIRNACASTGELENGMKYYIRNKTMEREYLKAMRLYIWITPVAIT